jgi:DNA-binding response OmpR family regulator
MPESPATQTNPARILLVDDDRPLCEMLGEFLTGEGFDPDIVHSGQAAIDALHAAQSGEISMVVLDITMPGLDGFETLRRIRTFSAIPVLMLTARGDEMDRIIGLEIGADDYLPKPFNSRELAARLRAVLRRSKNSGERDSAAEQTALSLDDLTLETGSQSILRDGDLIPLTSTEYAIAELLIRSAGEVVTKEEISKSALGRRWTPYDRSLDTHIANLRKKLGPSPNNEPRIKTLRGKGYLFAIHH